MGYQLNEKLYKDITALCLEGYDSGKCAFELFEQAWKNVDFPMHCPEHHYLVPAVLLTVCRKLRNDEKTQLVRDLNIAEQRAKNLLAGFCGWYGACGAAVGSGVFLSLLTDTSPYSTDTWALVNRLTSNCLREISAMGGPRCCKRVCFATLKTTAVFLRKNLDLDIREPQSIKCGYHHRNTECKKTACPYYSE